MSILSGMTWAGASSSYPNTLTSYQFATPRSEFDIRVHERMNMNIQHYFNVKITTKKNDDARVRLKIAFNVIFIEH